MLGGASRLRPEPLAISCEPVPHEMNASADYVARVNRAIDHILHHLADKLRLEDVASVAHFSPFHFHRVFRSLTGETLHQFVRRLRLERALYLLSHEPDVSLTDVALRCGFASSSDFSRGFKQRFGVPPSAFDVRAFRESRRGEMLDAITGPESRHLLERLPIGQNPDGFAAVLRDLPARTVAYIRIPDPYQSDGVARAAERLVAWAEARGVADGAWLGYMWDDPDIVALEDCRYDTGIELPAAFAASWKPEGEVGRIEFPPMRVAEIEIRGPIDLEQRAIDWTYRTWLPQSGYVPDDHPAFEAWIGRPFAHGVRALRAASCSSPCGTARSPG